MRKLSILFLFCFANILPGLAQNSLPSIKASTSKLDIRVGTEFFSKDGWTLEPNKNPDVFSVGSKWPYTTKKVTFVTNLDSISFDVQAGHSYDFIVWWGRTPCHIQIRTLKDPVFLNIQSGILLAIGFFLFIFPLYLSRKKLNTNLLLACGYITTVLFWTMTLISGYIHGYYNHFRNTISELGAIWSKAETFTSVSLLLTAAMNILFCIGFYRASKTRKLSTVPAVVSFAMPLTMIWTSVFTLGNEFHSSAGPLPLLVIIAAALCVLLWKDKQVHALRISSLVSFVLMMLLLSRFLKPFGMKYEGLVQRFFYLGWTSWTISVSLFLSKKPVHKGQ